MKTLVLVTLCLLGHAHAAPILFTFSGTGTGTLGASTFRNARFTITANADTLDASDVNTAVRQILLQWATVRIDGFATQQFDISLRLFHSPFVSYPPGPGGQTVGLSLATGADLLNLSHQLFVGYNLVSDLGPVFVPTPDYQSRLSFNNIPTSAGPMTLLSSANVTFTAQLLPEPPELSCPEPLTLECTNGWAAGTLQVGVLDTNGFPLEVIWTVDGTVYQTNNIPSGGATTSANVTFTANFGEGVHTVVISASNGQTTPASCSTTVTVSDTTPPTVSRIYVTPSVLWPPNHRMVPVSVIVDALDNCDPSPLAHITHVISNESKNSFEPDWEITGPLSVKLRAERSGRSHGRTYTIVIECEDASGNVSTASVDVVVPHDHR